MLVSHWSVGSAATVQLITQAVGATARDKRLGRAEALRQAMLAMIDTGKAYEAHPSYWAPFVVVGEGGARGPGRSTASRCCRRLGASPLSMQTTNNAADTP
jgi:hypothetical protein